MTEEEESEVRHKHSSSKVLLTSLSKYLPTPPHRTFSFKPLLFCSTLVFYTFINVHNRPGLLLKCLLYSPHQDLSFSKRALFPFIREKYITVLHSSLCNAALLSMLPHQNLSSFLHFTSNVSQLLYYASTLRCIPINMT